MSGENLRIEVPSPGADLVVVKAAIPECPDNGLLIKTSNAGMCHSDIHIWQDKWRLSDEATTSLTAFSDKVTWPMVMGHEVSGEVYAIGKNVTDTDLKIGDNVAVYPWVGCGDCGTCWDGNTNLCLTGGIPYDVGIGVTPGGYQSYVALKQTYYAVKIDGDMPTDVACMFGCSALTSFQAASQAQDVVERAARCCEEARFLVIGAGGLGLWCVQIARALYPANTKIFVADVAEEKLKLAKEYGADEVILWQKEASEGELIEKTKKMTGGIDGCADFVGIPSTTSKAFAVANKGAIICVVGLSGGMLPLSLAGLVLQCATVTGIYVGNRQKMVELVELYKKKKLRAPPINHITPEEANDAIHKLQQGKILGRSIINFK